MGDRVQRRRRGVRPVGAGRGAPSRPDRTHGREGQLLGHGRYRALRSLFGDPHRPGGRGRLRPAGLRPGLRLRPLPGDLEPGVHAVLPRRKGHHDAPAQTLHRHRHGAGAGGSGGPRQDQQLRLRPVHADHRACGRPGRQTLPRNSGRRRVHAGDRRPCPGHHLSRRRRRAAGQRGARLRAPADHAPRYPLRPRPWADQLLPRSLRARHRTDAGRLPAPERHPRPARQGGDQRGAALRRDARSRSQPARPGDPPPAEGPGRPGGDPRRVHLQALRHLRLPGGHRPRHCHREGDRL